MVWKITWGIWQILTRPLESLKIETLMGLFCQKLKMYELKTYMGVMFHDNEEWRKNWREIELPVQKWPEEFDEFWFEHSKPQKFTIYWAVFDQSICLSLKSTEELCLIALKTDAKFEEKLICTFKNGMRNLGNFHQSTWKSRNRYFDGILLSKVRKCVSLKFTGELFLMKMKKDRTLEEQLTCRFKIDMRTLVNFDPSTWKFLTFAL